jgi:hypothetical protein
MTSNFTVFFEGGSFTENRGNKLKSCKNHITGNTKDIRGAPNLAKIAPGEFASIAPV